MCDHCGCTPSSHPSKTGEGHSQRVELEQEVLAHDRKHAQALRARLHGQGARMINVVGSPGCGKTALIASLIPVLVKREIPTVVIEGDLATDNDAKRIAATGAPSYQITTGTACHLTAHDVEHAIEHLTVTSGTLVIVENVGNLVCPSMFDIGESLRVVCLSVTEGTDKPQKYPVSFRDAKVAAITKVDLLQHVDFDIEASSNMMRQIHPELEIVLSSAKTGLGLDEFTDRFSRLWV